MAKIHTIKPTNFSSVSKKRVAAYARISKESERMAHSLSAQISYYSSYIQSNPAWEYVGVYFDDGISGTSRNGRDEFNRMLEACENGLIDIILTKSISRFARNTVDLLTVVRKLRALEVEVRFEKEHINTMSEDGEFMLTILAAFAQEEARAVSTNVKWALRNGYSQGKYHGTKIYGYRWNGAEYVIEPKEAEVVRLIYNNYLAGISAEKTKRQLDDMGILALNGGDFNVSVIREILSNITYTGDILLQKSFIRDDIEKRKVKNSGELTQYLVKNAHEPIISREVYRKVQDEICRRRELGQLANTGVRLYCFSTKIRCGKCGKNFTHNFRSKTKQEIWCCNTKRRYGAGACTAKDIPDIQLKRTLADILKLDNFDEKVFLDLVAYISVPDDWIIRVHMKDGLVIEKKWENTARKDCITPELRRKLALSHSIGQGHGHRSWLAGKIKCGKCGRFFHKRYRKPNKTIYWRCPNCLGTAIDESKIVKAYKMVSSEPFEETIDYILKGEFLEFYFYDNNVTIVEV